MVDACDRGRRVAGPLVKRKLTPGCIFSAVQPRVPSPPALALAPGRQRRLCVKMTEASGGDLVEALLLIRDRARFGLQSDAEGARNALVQIGKLCDQALTTKPEPDSGGSPSPPNC